MKVVIWGLTWLSSLVLVAALSTATTLYVVSAKEVKRPGEQTAQPDLSDPNGPEVSQFVGRKPLLIPAEPDLSAQTSDTSTKPAPEAVALLAMWNPQVEFVADLRKETDRLTPTLRGHLYLMDKNGNITTAAEGDQLLVSVYEEKPQTDPSDNPIFLESWTITPACLKASFTKDTFGAGYTLSLPWHTYRADIKRVKFVVRFLPANGMKLWHEGSVMTLAHSALQAATP
jgi:hypothetical protein